MKSAAGMLALAVCATGAQATNLSFTGVFSHDNDVQSFTFTVNSASTVTLRSWSYAGGVNAHGDTIARGGFDPILALFDSAGDKLYEQDDATCSGAAADAITARCYDVNYTSALAPGSYTLRVPWSPRREGVAYISSEAPGVAAGTTNVALVATPSLAIEGTVALDEHGAVAGDGLEARTVDPPAHGRGN